MSRKENPGYYFWIRCYAKPVAACVFKLHSGLTILRFRTAKMSSIDGYQHLLGLVDTLLRVRYLKSSTDPSLLPAQRVQEVSRLQNHVREHYGVIFKFIICCVIPIFNNQV